jgi:Na+-driven multidrug efflux pump
MRDLTQGPIPGHLLAMAAPIAAGMLAQTLYFLIDLLLVAQSATRRSRASAPRASAMFVVMALTQMLGVGAMSLVSQAVGRKDHDDADLVFNQSLSLAGFCTVGTILRRILACAPLHADRGGGRCDGRGRHDLPLLVHAGTRACST